MNRNDKTVRKHYKWRENEAETIKRIAAQQRTNLRREKGEKAMGSM